MDEERQEGGPNSNSLTQLPLCSRPQGRANRKLADGAGLVWETASSDVMSAAVKSIRDYSAKPNLPIV